MSFHRLIAACALLTVFAVVPAASADPAVTSVTQVSAAISWDPVAGAASYAVTWDGGSATVANPAYSDMTLPCATARTYTITPQDSTGSPLVPVSQVTATSGACPAPVEFAGHDVFMFYYPWYRTATHDASWAGWQILPSYDPAAANIASDFWPLGGPYSVADPATLDRQFAEVRQTGADVLVESWDGPGSPEDQLTPMILDRAAAAGLRVAFQLEPYAGRSATSLAVDIAYLNTTYGGSPAFYRTTRPGLSTAARAAGQGLFFLYDPDQSMWPKYCSGCVTDVAPAYWKPAIDAVHASAGGGIVLGTGQYTVADLQAAHMDGGYLYAEPASATNDPYQVARQWELSMPPTGWAIPSVTPGFANDCAQASTSITAPRLDGATYDQQWNEMWNGPPLDDIAITSFNEWHEGTQIEPAAYGQTATGSDAVCAAGVSRYQDYGSVGSYGFLYRTAGWVSRFAASPLPAALAGATSVSERLGAVNTDAGISQLDTSDGITGAGVAMASPARSARPNGKPRRYTYFSVQNQFAYKLTKASRFTVSVSVLDTGGGPVSLQYDGLKNAFTTAPTSFKLTGTKTWKTFTWKLTDAAFGNRENSGADLRILTPGDRATWIRSISVSR